MRDEMETKSVQRMWAPRCVSLVLCQCCGKLWYCRRSLFFSSSSSSSSSLPPPPVRFLDTQTHKGEPQRPFPFYLFRAPAVPVQFCQACAEKENIGLTSTTLQFPRVTPPASSPPDHQRNHCLSANVSKWHEATVRECLRICPSRLVPALTSTSPQEPAARQQRVDEPMNHFSFSRNFLPWWACALEASLFLVTCEVLHVWGDMLRTAVERDWSHRSPVRFQLKRQFTGRLPEPLLPFIQCENIVCMVTGRRLHS